MKLGEVVKKTGLSKRTIYFYIEEHFLTPDVNDVNGYYNFSMEDVKRLQMLQQLRKADFSIKDIHAILKHPASAYIYIQKQVEALKKERELLNRQIGSLQNLYDRLPIFVSEEELSDAVFHTDFPDDSFLIPEDLNSDASIVSLYLWGPFLNDVTMTEYQRYLWKKLLAETARVHSEELFMLKKYVYSLSAEELDRKFAVQSKHIAQVSTLNEIELMSYIEEAKLKLAECAGNKEFVSLWKKEYQPSIQPTLTLYDSDFNTLVSELSPRFSTYYNNIHKCCDAIYKWLLSEDGMSVKKALLEKLEGSIDLCANHHAQIAMIVGVRKI